MLAKLQSESMVIIFALSLGIFDFTLTAWWCRLLGTDVRVWTTAVAAARLCICMMMWEQDAKRRKIRICYQITVQSAQSAESGHTSGDGPQ